MRPACLGSLLLLVTLPARADGFASGVYTLSLDGADGGLVRSLGDSAKKRLVVSTDEPNATLLGNVRAFLDGTVAKKSLVLSTPALVQKANDALLVDVRLPSYAGGANELAFGFEVGSTATSPSFRTASDRRRPQAEKLAAFRIALGDLPTNGATRLDAITLRKKDGATVPSDVTFDVPSNDAPPFLAWSKKPSSRDGTIEYVSTLGATVFGLKLAGCTATSVKIDGPITHVVVACKRARA